MYYVIEKRFTDVRATGDSAFEISWLPALNVHTMGPVIEGPCGVLDGVETTAHGQHETITEALAKIESLKMTELEGKERRSEIDPMKYGVLWQRVQDMDKKMDKMERQLEELVALTTGDPNTAHGESALYNNTTGINNTASGVNALRSNTTGSYNTASGRTALRSNTTGSRNTASGLGALSSNTTGSGNTALGSQYTIAGAYSPAFDCTTENNRISMAHTGITNAYIQVAWTVVSDSRDKTDFAEVPHGLDFVTKLKPIAYRFKETRESEVGHGPLRYGFKAQDILELEGPAPVIVDADDPDKLRFNDQSLIAVLAKAIQELKAEFDAYKLSHP